MKEKITDFTDLTSHSHIFFSGTVIPGLGLGKKLGTHTANLSPRRVPKKLPFGIYAVVVKTPNGFFKGVCHYGPRPAVQAPVSFEVHCFGLQGNLYGKRITVEIKKRLRGIKNFPTSSALKKQIQHDKSNAKKALRSFTLIPSPSIILPCHS